MGLFCTRNRPACPYGIYLTLLTSIMIGSSLSYVHHSRHLTTFQSLLHNIEFSCDTKSMYTHWGCSFGTTWSECTTSSWVWWSLILYYQFFFTDVGVCASSQLWCEMDITSCGGSHVPFTGKWAPTEAVMFPLQGTGCPRRQPRSLHGGQGAHRGRHVPFTGTGRPCKHPSTTGGVE